MRVLLTGASSGLGKALLPALESSERVAELWCGSRRPVSGGAKVRHFPLDLEADFSLDAVPAPVDLVVHVAGLTHSADPARYDAVNRAGTARLAKAARARGCRRFVYVSTRCVGEGSGAYGESKRAAEAEVRALDWERLLIVRPAEVYGAGSREGIDSFMRLAERLRVVPMLFGDGRVSFAPIHADDFTRVFLGAVLAPASGVEVVEARGPELLDGVEVALRLARRHGALPVPVPVPLLGPLGALARVLGVPLFQPDQLARLTGGKSDGPLPVDGRSLRRFPG